MKSCTGCAHLLHWRGIDGCTALPMPRVQTTNPFTGTVTTSSGYYEADGVTPGWVAPEVVDVRAVGGACGPDAKLCRRLHLTSKVTSNKWHVRPTQQVQPCTA